MRTRILILSTIALVSLAAVLFFQDRPSFAGGGRPSSVESELPDNADTVMKAVIDSVERNGLLGEAATQRALTDGLERGTSGFHVRKPGLLGICSDGGSFDSKGRIYVPVLEDGSVNGISLMVEFQRTLDRFLAAAQASADPNHSGRWQVQALLNQSAQAEIARVLGLRVGPTTMDQSTDWAGNKPVSGQRSTFMWLYLVHDSRAFGYIDAHQVLDAGIQDQWVQVASDIDESTAYAIVQGLGF
jgi:hypothetical protein